jgi:hypothetical protein
MPYILYSGPPCDVEGLPDPKGDPKTKVCLHLMPATTLQVTDEQFVVLKERGYTLYEVAKGPLATLATVEPASVTEEPVAAALPLRSPKKGHTVEG